MCAYRISAESKTVKVSVGAPDLAVKAMTAHGSKGLEFDYVFIPYANEEVWALRSHGSSFVLPKTESGSHAVPDTRRLLYVAITRARVHSSILYSLEESDGKALTPLRFISELHPDSVSTKVLPREDIATPVSRVNLSKKVSTNTDNLDLLTHEAKTVLLKKGLSVTALNHFMDCPSKFLYESILKLPQAPSVSSEKGSAMHEALAEVWIGTDRSKDHIEKLLFLKITEYIDASFLSSTDKIALKKELSDDAPAVAAALAPHFAIAGVVSAESWVETLFDGVYEKVGVTIPLHGKLDVIIDNGNRVEIFDYKTRQALSVAAIKGETKTSDGNYFRQLAFYRLLVENDFRFRNKNITTSLVFVSPDDKGRCPTMTLPVEDSDVKNLKTEIQTLVDSVWSGKVSTEYCDDRQCKYCGYKKLLSN